MRVRTEFSRGAELCGPSRPEVVLHGRGPDLAGQTTHERYHFTADVIGSFSHTYAPDRNINGYVGAGFGRRSAELYRPHKGLSHEGRAWWREADGAPILTLRGLCVLIPPARRTWPS